MTSCFLFLQRVMLGLSLLSMTALGQAPAANDGAQAEQKRKLEVSVADPSGKPLAGVRLAVRSGETELNSVETGADGRATLEYAASGQVTLTAKKDGFFPLERPDIDAAPGQALALEVTLQPQPTHKEQVNVTAEAEAVTPTAGAQAVPVEASKELPSRPATVSDALPLIPGVMRSPIGSLSISGAAEHRSAMVVNSADVTDPATGQFGQTVPIDIVESLDVLQTPFLAEYGRFTAGLVKVETKRGGEKWKADVNDPFPDFRIRSYHMMGIRDATPRVNFEGPLIKGKLYLSEGVEYEVQKISVLTLPFPYNQKKTQGFNSFSQFDYILSDTHLLTGTFHIAPQLLNGPNMDFFNPLPTNPDASLHNSNVTIGDHWTVFHSDLLENTASFTRFTARTWPLGPDGLSITPNGNTGNYFETQDRSASRFSWQTTYALHALTALGAHNLKFGGYVDESSEYAHVLDRPINIADTSGTLLESIQFVGGAPIRQADTQLAFFAEDHWLLTPKLALDLGVRTESQQITEAFRIAPRSGLAWTPVSRWRTVFRAGIGLFYDRVPLSAFGFANYPERIITTYDATGQILTPPTLYVNALGEVASHSPFVFREDVVGNFSPDSTTWNFNIEQPIGSILKLRVNYTQNQSSGVVLLNPLAPVTPGGNGTMLLSGSGHSRYRQFDVTARLRLQNEKQQLFFSYVRSQARGDINDFSRFLGSFPIPLIRSDQYSTLPTDMPNRFLMWGLLHFPWKFQMAPIVEYRTGFPYAQLTAAQTYLGIPYSTRFPNFFSVDARASKDFQVTPKYGVRISVSGMNLTNHFNPDTIFNNQDATEFGVFFGQHKRRFQADIDFLF